MNILALNIVLYNHLKNRAFEKCFTVISFNFVFFLFIYL